MSYVTNTISSSSKTLTHTTLSRKTIGLHWAVAITVLSLAGVGLYMKYTETWALYDWHKSFGVCALLVILARIVWRAKEGWLKPVAPSPKHELKLARAIQWFLIIATLLMPVSGMLLSGASGHGLNVFSFTLVPSNPSPTNPAEIIPYSEALMSLGAFVHSWSGYLLLAAVALHIAGALKHHFMGKDRTLLRMLGRNNNG